MNSTIIKETKQQQLKVCPLCLEVKQIKEFALGHIISRHHYKNLGIVLNEDDEGMYVNFDEVGRISNAQPINKSKSPIGIREYLVCKVCDNKVIGSTLENYSAELIYNQKLREENYLKVLDVNNLRQGMFIEWHDVKYTTFKNYILSILWRNSVSRLTHYAHVNLGENINEELREIIFNNKSTSENKFKIYIWACNQIYDYQEKLISPFIEMNEGGVKFYIWTVGIFTYFIQISGESKIPFVQEGMHLKETGTFPVKIIPNIMYVSFIKFITRCRHPSFNSQFFYNILFHDARL